jgi:hypothetical protein
MSAPSSTVLCFTRSLYIYLAIKELSAYYFVSFHVNVWAAICHLHDNLPDALDLLTFLPGIAGACRVENSLI